MPIVHSLTDAEVSDPDRRKSIFAGNVFVYGPRPSSRALAAASRVILEQAFGPTPTWAQERLSETEFSVLFDAAARNLTAIALQLASAVVADFGCDPDTTFVGCPSLVATTGLGYVAHALGIPRHPHRDTWYAASPAELNWWVPLYELDDSAALAFHPVYWNVPVKNSSSSFDVEEWHRVRLSGRTASLTEPFAQPRPLDPIDLTPDLRISCPAGGVVLSSVAQLYSTVPNESKKTHFSVHFQSVSESDLEAGAGATDLDAAAPGTSLTTFIRSSDLSPMPEDLIALDLQHRRAAAARRSIRSGDGGTTRDLETERG